MPNNIIAFDCDDVLVNLRDPMSRMLASVTQTPYRHWETWDDYDLPRRYGLSTESFIDAMKTHDVLSRGKLEPGVPDVFHLLRGAGYAIEIWTARKWHPRARSLTQQQLRCADVAPEHIRLFDLGESKAEKAVEQNITALVDDNPHHLVELESLSGNASEGCCGFLLNRPWNQSHRAGIRCHHVGGCL